jgi:Trp operon repressor
LQNHDAPAVRVLYCIFCTFQVSWNSKPIWGWSDGGEWSTQAAKCIRLSNTKEKCIQLSLALHNKKIKARRNQVASLLSKSFSETEIAQQLGVDQSTISRDIKVLKESAQQFVYDLAKSDLAYYYKQSIDGIEEAKKESWKIYNDSCSRIDVLDS